MEWIDIVLEEYKTVREEGITSIQRQQSILRFGIASLGILLVAGFNLWEKSLLPEIIFLLFVPVMSYLALFVWLGEVARMIRTSKYIIEIEEKVNKIFVKEQPALKWENWLRQSQNDGKTQHIIWNYISVISMFIFIALASIGVGCYKVYPCLSFKIFVSIILIESFFFITVIIFLFKQSRKLR